MDTLTPRIPTTVSCPGVPVEPEMSPEIVVQVAEPPAVKSAWPFDPGVMPPAASDSRSRRLCCMSPVQPRVENWELSRNARSRTPCGDRNVSDVLSSVSCVTKVALGLPSEFLLRGLPLTRTRAMNLPHVAPTLNDAGTGFVFCQV